MIERAADLFRQGASASPQLRHRRRRSRLPSRSELGPTQRGAERRGGTPTALDPEVEGASSTRGSPMGPTAARLRAEERAEPAGQHLLWPSK